MWLVVGLGNPGPPYNNTRHNVGFQVVQTLASRLGGLRLQPAFGALMAVGGISSTPVGLVLPMTFMNRSGGPVGDISFALGVPSERVLVVHDDLDLAFGRIRCKAGGGHGGHNGLRDIARRVGREFLRVRVGIGRPPDGISVSDHVLGSWNESEQAARSALLDHVADAVESIVNDGIQAAMNQFNTRQPAAGRDPQNRVSTASAEVGEHK